MPKLQSPMIKFLSTEARRVAQFFAAALALVATQVSFAAEVYNNGAPDQVSGTQMSEHLVAEDFTLAAATTVGSFRFWSIQQSAADYLGSVYWAVHSNVGGSPGATILFGGTTVAAAAAPTGASTVFGYDEYLFNIDVADFVLPAGNYWFALHNGPLTEIKPTEMLWETTGTIGSESKYFDSSFGWTDAGTNLAFVLNGTGVVDPPTGVPEPGTLALIGLALAAARIAGRRA